MRYPHIGRTLFPHRQTWHIVFVVEPRRGTRVTGEELRGAFGTAPFTAAEALERGISRRRLQSAVASGVVRHVDRTHYAVGELDADQYLLALQHDWESRGASVVAGVRSAADIWAAPVLGRHGPLPPSTPTFWVPDGVRPGTRRGSHLIVGDIPESHVVTLESGLRVTSPIRTAIDAVRLARIPRYLALATLCHAARLWLAHQSGLIAPTAHDMTKIAQDPSARDAARQEILRVLDESPQWGATAVRSAVPWVDARLENALETTSWGRFIDAGVPMPVPQVWLRGASGCWYRVDFWWEALGLIGEADGMVKYRSPRDLAEEKARQLDLEGPGRSMTRWGWTHVIRDGDPLLAGFLGRLRAAA